MSGLLHAAGLRGGARHLLDIQRDAVRPLDQLRQQRVGDRRALHHVARQAHGLDRIQPVDGEMRHMLAGGAEIPVLSAGHQHQHRCARGELDQGHREAIRRTGRSNGYPRPRPPSTRRPRPARGCARQSPCAGHRAYAPGRRRRRHEARRCPGRRATARRAATGPDWEMSGRRIRRLCGAGSPAARSGSFWPRGAHSLSRGGAVRSGDPRGIERRAAGERAPSFRCSRKPAAICRCPPRP